jgi:hypothetical protein
MTRSRCRRPLQTKSPGIYRHAVSAGAERLSAHRPRQVDLPEFRHRAGIRRPLPPALRRHQPDQGGAGIHRRHRADVRWLGFDWGKHLYHASDYFERLYDWAEHLIRAGKAYVDDQSQDEMRAMRGTLTEPARTARSATAPWRKPRPVPPHEGRRISERRARAARQDRHGVRQHQPARPRALSHPARPHPRTGTRGRSIRATTSRTASPTRSRASRIRSARWNSRTTGRSTTGSSTTCRCRRGRASTNSRGSISDLHGAVQARADQLVRAAMSPAGTIRACRRWPACAGAACRRRRSAISSSASVSPRPTAWSMSPCSITRSARCSTSRRSAAWRCCGRSRS